MKRKQKIKKEENGLWEEGCFIEKVRPEEIEEKMKTFYKGHNEDMEFNCRKCNKKISAHNKDWHDGMCDECFFDAFSKRKM